MTVVLSGPQECECGNETYEIYLIGEENRAGIVAACEECGRITGSVGEGVDYRGKTIGEVSEA